MCGRFVSILPPDSIARLFGTTGTVPAGAPSWNVAPGQQVLVVRRDPATGARRLDRLSWGLVPHWTKDLSEARKPVNARAETVTTIPMFRDAFLHRRCLVPVEAFYEWQPQEKAAKQPYAVARVDGDPFALAAIWEAWRGADGTLVESFALVVTDANDDLLPIHPRMPVIVEPEDWPLWLGEVPGDARHLLTPAATGTLRCWPVGLRVNHAGNDDAHLLDPVERRDRSRGS